MARTLIRYFTRLSFSAFIVCFPLVAIAADFDYAAYKRATIPEILEKHKSKECRPTPTTALWSIFSAPHKYRIITVFSGQFRPLSMDAKEFLIRYGKAFSNQRFVELYRQELLVKDSGRDYWVPVQDPLLPAMNDELQMGRRFELYIALLGATNNRCIFVATEFDANPK